MRITAKIFCGVSDMIIDREKYLNKLISKRDNGLIKIITGIRRCGKSFLLFELYQKYLNDSGVDDNHIIKIALDDVANARYRNPIELDKHIREFIIDSNQRYYVFIDEIQLVATIQNPYLGENILPMGACHLFYQRRNMRKRANI